MHEDDIENWNFIPVHQSSPPLRWIANGIFHPISMWFFKIGLRANDNLEWDTQYTLWNKFVEHTTFKLYEIFDYPYSKWGTYYTIDYEIEDWS
jgi:hypothetical protein